MNKENEGGKHRQQNEKQNGKPFLHSLLLLYACLDLRTNPFEERENDVIKSKLSIWKET